MKNKSRLLLISILIITTLLSGCLPSVSETVNIVQSQTALALNPILPTDTSTVTRGPTKTQDPNSTMTPSPTAFQPPTLVVDSGVNVWVKNVVDENIVVFNDLNMQQLMAINIEGEIGDVIDAFGAIWVSDILNQKIYRIDRNAFQITNVIPTQTLKIKSLSYDDNYIWVGVQETDTLPDINASPFGGILQIDPATNEIVNYIDMQSPIVEFAFSDTKVWALAETNEYYTIKTIDFDTREITEGGQYGIWQGHTRIFGNNQGVWVINENMPDTIMHLDHTTDVLLSTIDMSRYPGAAYDMIGVDNTLWILLDQGSVVRVDLQYNTTLSVIPVSRYCKELFFAGDNVYSLSHHDGKVYQILADQNRLGAVSITGSRLPTPTPTINPDIVEEVVCEGEFVSRLSVGMEARVSEYPPYANRVRSKPEKDGSIIGYIDPGEKVEILEGPNCSDEWVWWKVKSVETGIIGWTAEGDDDVYWLTP
ncbi:MAG: SH3 domain-containing protein [Anaerolineaceae bacterium]|nr:SH3 domain-containing protein [Anaerolineaceae bacterium]